MNEQAKNNSWKDITEKIRNRLQEPLPGSKAHELMIGRVRALPVAIPANARQSGVLCLIFPLDKELNILLMKRKEDKTAHSGQVSFPGGKHEPGDADYKATALREAQEEVGINAADVEILGMLTTLYIPVSNFNVHPYLAYSPGRPVYHLSHHEVSYVLEVPLNHLFHKNRKIVTEVISPAIPGSTFTVNAYQLEGGTIIWGATAMILSEIEILLQGIL